MQRYHTSIHHCLDSDYRDHWWYGDCYTGLAHTHAVLSSPFVDMRETIDEIVHLSKMPVSIVIAGVGDANFDEMMKLDADLEPLEASWGERAERDIVQVAQPIIAGPCQPGI